MLQYFSFIIFIIIPFRKLFCASAIDVDEKEGLLKSLLFKKDGSRFEKNNSPVDPRPRESIDFSSRLSKWKQQRNVVFARCICIWIKKVHKRRNVIIVRNSSNVY